MAGNILEIFGYSVLKLKTIKRCADGFCIGQVSNSFADELVVRRWECREEIQGSARLTDRDWYSNYYLVTLKRPEHVHQEKALYRYELGI